MEGALAFAITHLIAAAIGFGLCFFVVRNNPKLDAEANKVVPK